MGMEDNLIHIYCGNGKGKTTAAVGLAVRAAGAGLKVNFCQFMKDGQSSELLPLQGINGINVKSVENPYGFTWQMTETEKKALYEINTQAVEWLKGFEKYQVVVMDEILSAYEYELVDRKLLIDFLKENKGEIILTGRNPKEELVEMADYVTEMNCVRHPFEKGIEARKGIEL